MTDEINKDDKYSSSTWVRPKDVMALHKLRMKKKTLEARMKSNNAPIINTNNDINLSPQCCPKSFKRKNPFVKDEENKKPKSDGNYSLLEESSDSTLFKLFHGSNTTSNSINDTLLDNTNVLPSFTKTLNKIKNESQNLNVSVKNQENWIPIDWTLKHKLRLLCRKRFTWQKKLKISEETTGITSFVRCLDLRTYKGLDSTPNAEFHHCCLFWQYPSFPWLQLFPRIQGKVSETGNSFATGPIKDTLQRKWIDSLRSIFQLVKVRQCPYFYVCTNSFTALFRAGGICGFSDLNVLVTPTTRGFRQLLRQEDIEFTMPLKIKTRVSDVSDAGYDTLDSSECTSSLSKNKTEDDGDNDEEDDDDHPSQQWLESLGVNEEEIKKINSTQAKINHRTECEIDNSEQSLIYIEGEEATGFYNFLINCKSIVASTGPLAGVPPTLISPVAFHGASLETMKVLEKKIRDNNNEYFSLELSGPIFPHTIHDIYSLLPKDCSVSATFANIAATEPFSKVKPQQTVKSSHSKLESSEIFQLENFSECGLNKDIARMFCLTDPERVQHYDSIKYNSETGCYAW